MSRFLSGFWGGNQQQAEEEQSSTATGSSSATTGAASWITMNDPPGGGRGEPVMAVNKSTVDDVLDKLGDEGAVNVVAIFGAARGGKSFLMNQLAGQDDIFKISNDKDPCTQGVDVSRAVVPLKDFAALDGCTAPRGMSASNQVRVLFADVEGQGDRDAAYDARLASAILPLTKCVIFNWRDSLQVDRMLNLLGVMQRAAHNVDLGDDGEGTSGPKFGHLHVVFRDWNYSGTAEDVKKQLFGLDNKGMGSEVAVKNELRRTITAAFASVTVWLFPAPVEMTSELSKELKSEDLSEGFVSELKAFRSTLSSQLSAPTVFGPANPVTGHSLGSLVPALVEVLNKGEVIMPQSTYQQMLDMEAQQVKKTYLAKADALIETGIKACDNGPPVPPKDLAADMEDEIQALLSDFKGESKARGAKADAVAEGAKEISDSLERGMQGLRAHNTAVLGVHLKTAVKAARAAFTTGFTQASRAKMPLPPSELTAMASAVSSRARGQLHAVPSAGPDDDTMEEALSALGDFIELAISKAEKENDSLLQAQGKKEEDALAAAIGSFQQDFTTDLQVVKAGGGPYKLSSVEDAGKAALATALAGLRRSLGVVNGGGETDRVASLTERLEERAAARVLEEKSEFDRSCSASMMALGTEERRRLREEARTDVYPLLPLYSKHELETVFQPVVRRMNDRIDSSARGWALSEQLHAQHMDSAKSDAEAVWQSLYERNERMKLQRENADMGANAQRNQEEAKRLRLRLGEERKKVQDAEGNAREATAAAAQARLAATTANQRMRQAVGAREREAAAREQERREEEAKRAEERERAAAEVARVTNEAAAREAKLAAEAAEAREAEQAAAAAAAAAAASAAAAEVKKGEVEEDDDDGDDEGFQDAMDVEEDMKERPKRGRKTAAKVELQEKAEEEQSPKKNARASSRRKTMMTPIGRDPATVKAAREEAAKQIKDRQDAQTGKGLPAEEEAEELEQEEEQEEQIPKNKARASSRRKTILTPIGRDPATMKAAREEAARQIKDRQDAKTGKGTPAKEEKEDEEEEEEDSGMTEREKSRQRAAQWAKDEKARKALEAKKKKAAAAKGESAAATPKKRGRR